MWPSPEFYSSYPVSVLFLVLSIYSLLRMPAKLVAKMERHCCLVRIPAARWNALCPWTAVARCHRRMDTPPRRAVPNTFAGLNTFYKWNGWMYCWDGLCLEFLLFVLISDTVTFDFLICFMRVAKWLCRIVWQNVSMRRVFFMYL